MTRSPAADPTSRATDGSARTIRSLLLDALHVFALTGFAVAQPLYDVLGRNADFFVVHRAGSAVIIGMIAVLSVLIPLALVLSEIVVAALLGQRARRALHWTYVAGLVALVALPPLNRVELVPAVAGLAIAATIGIVAALAYSRLAAARSVVTFTAVGAMLFPVTFAADTPVRSLLFADDVRAIVGAEIADPVPIVLVVFDELHTAAILDESGEIDEVRFPHFAEFARDAWWFPNAVGPSPSTEIAVPAILTGRQPKARGTAAATAADHPENLFVLLGDSYDLNVLESQSSLCPAQVCSGEEIPKQRGSLTEVMSDVVVVYLHLVTPTALGGDLPTLDARWKGFRDPPHEGGSANASKSVPPGLNQRSAQIDDFLSGVGSDSSRPTLDFLHVILPHLPYEYFPSGRTYPHTKIFPDGILSEESGWGDNEHLIETAYLRYLQQVGFVDRFMGRLIARLKDEGIYSDALMIVTADHGVAFAPGENRRLDDANVTETLKVPMFVKLPGRSDPKRDERLVGGIDVVPTILDVIGMPPPSTMDGRSMVDLGLPPRDSIDVAGVGRLTAAELAGFPALDWQVERFGSRTPLEGLTLRNARSGLVGRNLDDVAVAADPSPWKVRTDDLLSFAHVDPDGDALPALFRGRVEGVDPGRDIDVAFALNGTIRTTTTASRWRDETAYFAVLFPETAFRKGRNELAAFVVEDGEKGPELVRLPVRSGNRRFAVLKTRMVPTEFLEFDDGSVVPVRHGKVDGYVDEVTRTGPVVSVSGWSADPTSGDPARSVVVIAGGESVAIVVPAIERPDVADALNAPGAVVSGFRAAFHASDAPSDEETFRVFGVSSRGVASPLALGEGVEDSVEEVFE